MEQVKSFIKDESTEWELLGDGIKRKIMTYENRVMLVKVAFEKGAVGTLHHHLHTQLSYLASGTFEVEINGVKEILHKGDVFHAQPNLVHGVLCLEEGELIDIFSPMREDFIKK